MIIRTAKNENYTTLANFALNDPNLSLKAKGLWAFIMSKPDGWNINYRGLMAQLKEGQRSILNALSELEEQGYLVRGAVHAEDGRFGQAESTLYEKPCAQSPRVHNARMETVRTKVKTEQVSTKQVITEEEITTNVVIEASASLTYGKPEINEMFLYWEEKTGVGIVSNVKRNRNACNSLFNKYGDEKLRQLIDGVALANEDQYAPRIADFTDLQGKLNQLLAWGKRRQGSANSVVAIS